MHEALTAGWRVHARCLEGVVDNTRSSRNLCPPRACAGLPPQFRTYACPQFARSRRQVGRVTNRQISSIEYDSNVLGRREADRLANDAAAEGVS
jgi:hypothetical protein